MSTNSECEFIDVEGEWFYVLEHLDAPKNAWDWREHATAYGPFRSEEAAETHLRDNHANPGGSSSMPMTKAEVEADDVMRELIEAARKRGTSRPHFGGSGWTPGLGGYFRF